MTTGHAKLIAAAAAASTSVANEASDLPDFDAEEGHFEPPKEEKSGSTKQDTPEVPKASEEALFGEEEILSLIHI